MLVCKCPRLMPKHGILLPRLAGLPVHTAALKVKRVSPSSGSCGREGHTAPRRRLRCPTSWARGGWARGEKSTLTTALPTVCLCCYTAPFPQGEPALAPTEVKGAVLRGGSALVGPCPVHRRAKHLQKYCGFKYQPAQVLRTMATLCLQRQGHPTTFRSPF